MHLHSRGIALQKAQELLLNAFLQNSLENSPFKAHGKDIISRIIKSARTDVVKKV